MLSIAAYARPDMLTRHGALAAAAALSASILLAGCAGHRAQPAPAGPPAVQTVTASVGSVHPTLSLPGIIAPLQDVQLSTTLTEPADSVDVQEGDHVRAGQELALLDTADLRANLLADIRTAQSDSAKTVQTQYNAALSITQGNDQVKSAQAALQQAQTTLRNDTVNLQRDQELLGQGFIAQQIVDQQVTTVRNDQQAVDNAQAGVLNAIKQQQVNGNGTSSGLQAADIASARADAAAAYAQADQIRTSIAKATIVSPVDGVVVNRNLNPGEYPGSRQIFTIQQTNAVYAILNATTVDIFHAPMNAAVSVTVQGQQEPYQGRVVAVLDQLTPGSTNFAVKVQIANPKYALHSGMPVTATITLAPSSGITIPTTAFLDDTHTNVLAVGSDNVAHSAKVSEVRSDGTNSIVNGLASGTQVIANGQAGIADGEKVTIANGTHGPSASSTEAAQN
jgi:multidrug efflux pump subunit AcrA (membrane-fusion protein)